MADDPKRQGRDRKLASTQEHEVAYIVKTAKVTRQKATPSRPVSGPEKNAARRVVSADAPHGYFFRRYSITFSRLGPASRIASSAASPRRSRRPPVSA